MIIGYVIAAAVVVRSSTELDRESAVARLPDFLLKETHYTPTCGSSKDSMFNRDHRGVCFVMARPVATSGI